MKKTFFTFLLAIIVCTGFAQNLLTFQINTTVYSSDGSDIKTGVVCSFTTYTNDISSGQVRCDISWWTSLSAKTKGDDRIWACTNKDDRKNTRIVNVFVPVSSPKELCYDTIQNYLLTWLQDIYGSGNVTIVE